MPVSRQNKDGWPPANFGTLLGSLFEAVSLMATK